MLRLAALLLVFLIPNGASAQDVRTPSRPIAGSYVVDEAAMLSAADAQVIRDVAGALDKDKRTPIVAVTIRSLTDYVPGGAGALSIERYAGIVFNTWGIGYPDHNFGILLLVSKGDRKARIELGAGWKRDYDDATARIMSQVLIPRFRQGDFSGGIRDAVKALDQMARADSPAAAASTAAPAGGGAGMTGNPAAMNTRSAGGYGGGSSVSPSAFASGNWGLFAIIGVFILITIIKSIARGGGGYSTGHTPLAGGSGLGNVATGFLLGSLLGGGGRSAWGGSSRGSSFGGGGGFGGGGFGGGFSGGGGASGSW